MKKSLNYKKPDWFNLENYKGLENLNSNKWAYQLYIRYIINLELKHKCDSCGKLCKINGKGEKKLRQLIQSPIVEKQTLFQFSAFQEDYKNKFFNLNHIAPLNRESAKLAPMNYPHEDELEDYFSSNFLEDDGVLDAQLTNMSIEFGVVYLTADLNASNEKLLIEFEKYLNNVRKIYGFEEDKIYKNTILERLLKLKVIPFLDLYLYSQIINCAADQELTVANDYPYHKYGDWLFPDDDVDVTEKVRKGTKELAMRSIQFPFIRSLMNITE